MLLACLVVGLPLMSASENRERDIVRTYYPKVWAVVGYSYNGAAWCVDCAHAEGIQEWADRPADVWAVMPAKFGDQPRPVFVSDLSDDLMSCDSCRELIDC